ncbi:D-glycero-beta-D-manno-heptose-7-phosphate kinase [Iodobacter ciconiae]|uniref:D-glycero-beta-D-manno-heptose-7-phosphate kinase n=1 Tax=Iodobacter ciconiae TaxID=2496266 RepID=A0A3S8ZRX7_9NEIS|nr:D-glycero-beta-D-manno-heptose-7-phosphate kinase [Iodobacter ciconiae]AZN36161.1 D-glycero-beta-D-manno-heptose-7-phosphate kinase [Iodobacter ciconiae]
MMLSTEGKKMLQRAVAKARVMVVGDVMLDRYWFGDVERISPEAPVPVARIRRTEERAGGAANVARNIAALGGQAYLLAVVGDDEAGRSLEDLLLTDKVNTYFHRDSHIDTTVKLRVLAKQQQLLRIDFESEPSHEVLAAKLDDFRAILPNVDVVILSDYGKGGLRHVQMMIEIARAAGKTVLVDPKGDEYERYRGATLLTPNRSEFKQVAGKWSSDDELAKKAESLRASLELDALLVTRSEEGMTLFRKQGVVHKPTHAHEVFDVSGAGDTVIATLGLMLAAGLEMPEAMDWSNRAAGVVVAKLGTAVVHPDELFA